MHTVHFGLAVLILRLGCFFGFVSHKG